MVKRLREQNGEIEKLVVEIILEKPHQALYNEVQNMLLEKLQFIPLKWQVSSMIYIAGLQATKEKWENEKLQV